MAHDLSSAEKSVLVRQAFDACAATNVAHDLASLNAAVDSAFSRMGFNVYAGFRHLAPGGVPDVHVLFGANQDAWEKRYLAKDYQYQDACVPLALKTAAPFYWSEVPSLVEVKPEAQHVFDEAAEFKLRDGFLVPMHSPDGSVSSVLLAGEHIDAHDPALRLAAHTLALHFGTIGQGIVAKLARQHAHPVELTPRQLECLRWVRDGKSSADIADLLSLSTRTVEHYIHNACGRLGVRTRYQAVTEAIARGLLIP